MNVEETVKEIISINSSKTSYSSLYSSIYRIWGEKVNVIKDNEVIILTITGEFIIDQWKRYLSFCSSNYDSSKFIVGADKFILEKDNYLLKHWETKELNPINWEIFNNFKK